MATPQGFNETAALPHFGSDAAASRRALISRCTVVREEAHITCYLSGAGSTQYERHYPVAAFREAPVVDDEEEIGSCQFSEQAGETAIGLRHGEFAEELGHVVQAVPAPRGS